MGGLKEGGWGEGWTWVDRVRAREKRARADFVLSRIAWDCAIERHLVEVRILLWIRNEMVWVEGP